MITFPQNEQQLKKKRETERSNVVCVLHMKPFYPSTSRYEAVLPVDIQHTPCPCSGIVCTSACQHRTVRYHSEPWTALSTSYNIPASWFTGTRQSHYQMCVCVLHIKPFFLPIDIHPAHQCVVFFLRSFYPSTPSTSSVRADSVHPREMQALFSQTSTRQET